jgi:hypothetical protein
MEPVHIKGIGDVEAKVDSGNADVNVIHGHSVKHDGDDVSFTTVYNKTIKTKKIGEDDHKRITKKIELIIASLSHGRAWLLRASACSPSFQNSLADFTHLCLHRLKN